MYLFLVTAISLLAADYAAEGKLWWAHVQFLADDKLEGRNVDSEGLKQAVSYVAGQFDKIGLKPAGTSGYLQAVKLETRLIVPDESKLALFRNDKEEPLVWGQDASLTARSEATGPVDAAMVFVGYGMSIPDAMWDDFAGQDLRGKIAVFVNAPAPVDVSGNLKSHFGSTVERWSAMKRAGAIGMAAIPNPRPPASTPNPDTAAAGTPPGRGRAGAGGGRGAAPTMGLADPALQEMAGQQVTVNITRRGAEQFFAGIGHTVEEIESLVRDGKALPRFPLVGRLRAQAKVTRASLESPNVVGMLPGSDAKLKDEYVIMSAHLDHTGISGRSVNGDNINNGAMDDASGIASVLEIARMMKESGAKSKRSIVFLAVTAEEKGELGSRYFAGRPTVPAKNIVADINLDMFLPLYPLKVIEVQGLTESTLGDQVRAAAKELGVDVQTDREPEQNRFIRSDQYSFIRNGVPALAFKFGYEAGSPDEKIRRDWVRDRYHKPSDDLNQPVDKDAAAKFNRVIMGLLLRVANDTPRPVWKDDSFFKRFAQ